MCPQEQYSSDVTTRRCLLVYEVIILVLFALCWVYLILAILRKG